MELEQKHSLKVYYFSMPPQKEANYYVTFVAETYCYCL